jgi:hypothetical protein
MTTNTKESLEAHALAGAGLLRGLAELAKEGFQTPEQSSSRAATLGWAAMLGSVALFDRYAPETLTNRAHRTKHPLFVKAAAITTALHVANLLPEKIDPITQFGKHSGLIKKAR